MAATAVLAEGTITVTKLVQRAGVGRSTFYEFFDGPEHVLAQLEQRLLRTLEKVLELGLADARTPLERVRAISRRWLSELEAHPVEARWMLSRRNGASLVSPAGELLKRALERCLEAARAEAGWASATDDLNLLAATAAVEAISLRHLSERIVVDAARVLAELIVKLLR
jgi:AcrR family transcriptional regulator